MLEHRHPNFQVHHLAESITIMEWALPVVCRTTTELSGFDFVFLEFGYSSKKTSRNEGKKTRIEKNVLGGVRFRETAIFD